LTEDAKNPSPDESQPASSHPPALYMLFFTEMWERFSYYGMRALLVLYMVQHFRFSDEHAYVVYGSYTALVYATPVFGGMLADRLLGYKKSVALGAIFMAFGHFAMAFDAGFYPALGLLIVGNGFFKPNISTIVGRLYPPGDKRRDAGFTIFYMGINLGAALAPALCGILGQTYGWHFGFGLAGVGMLVGLGVFLSGQRLLSGLADPPDEKRLNDRVWFGLSREILVYVGAVGIAVLAWQLVQHGAWVGRLLSCVGVVVVLGIVTYLLRLVDPVERHRLQVALVLTGFSIVFWAFFEQAGSSLNLFTDRNVDRRLSVPLVIWLGAVVAPFGGSVPAEVPASIFQAVNPVFILLLAPLFGTLWVVLGRSGWEPSLPLKFGLGIIQLGLGFGTLWLGAHICTADGIVGVGWLLLAYLFHTTGELCLSPIGLSMITKLSPSRIVGLMMGTWFLSSAFAQYAAGLIAALTGVRGNGAEAGALLPPPSVTVHVYGSVFGGVAAVALAVGIVLTLAAPALSRRTHGIA
jgi:proton-dependent oligopeptide transporter, POT family